MTFGCRSVLWIFSSRVGWCTLSNALDMSTAMAAVRRGGFWLLKPWATFVVSGRSAVVVEWRDLKPCCVGMSGIVFVMSGRISLSRILLAGQSREIGR